jgi:hypothetical protein
MKTKIQIKSIWGSVLFEFEKEDNSIKKTLEEAVINRADLRGAYLRGAYLQRADLQGAYLRGAYLRGAYLQRADLQGAYLRGADLQRADLQGADLQGADLQGADLQGADLQGADLRGAYLRGADLQGADLRGADLQGADLQKIYNVTTILPEGELIVWKKLKYGLIAKLLIQAKVKRVNAIGTRKCRFECAKVLAIYHGKKRVAEGFGIYDEKLKYIVGNTVHPDSFDPSPLVVCSNGIHAFITRQEAEDY